MGLSYLYGTEIKMEIWISFSSFIRSGSHTSWILVNGWGMGGGVQIYNIKISSVEKGVLMTCKQFEKLVVIESTDFFFFFF